MYFPDSSSTAILILFLGLLFWGTWPNSVKLVPAWRIELFYWDFTVAMPLATLLIVATLGSLFSPPTVWQNLASADSPAWSCAFLAGIIWNIGNILLLSAIDLVGIAVAFPVGVGLGLVLGTIATYLVDPRGDPLLLFSGAALILAAILTSSLANYTVSSQRARSPRLGLILSLAAGIFIAATGPLIGKSFTSPRPLAAYGVLLIFTVAAVLTSLVLIPILMRRPVSGPPLSAADYFLGSRRAHLAGFFGAVLLTCGTASNYIGAQKVGVALAFAIGQANPLVAAIWGVFYWREFHGAPKRARLYLTFMFLFYLFGLLFLSQSQSSKTLP